MSLRLRRLAAILCSPAPPVSMLTSVRQVVDRELSFFVVRRLPYNTFVEPNIEMGVRGDPHVSTSDDHCASDENVTIAG